MFSNPDEVMRYIQEEDVKFIDVRFCDLPGVMQHFNVPAESVDEEFFANGQMFDGSSIRGFQAIHESDMKLTPDLGSAYLDPFRAEKTLIINMSASATRSPMSCTAATRATSPPRPRRT